MRGKKTIWIIKSIITIVIALLSIGGLAFFGIAVWINDQVPVWIGVVMIALAAYALLMLFPLNYAKQEDGHGKT